MNLKTCFVMLALSIGRFSMAEESTCVYDKCTCAYNKVTCTGLNSIPPLVKGSGVMTINHVIFMNGYISEVGDNSLPANLSVIHINNNPITHISSNAFQDSSTTLESLVIRNASLRTLPGALLELQSLRHIAIFDTFIEDWNTTVVHHINYTVQSINLQNVGLNEWPSWLHDFSLLESIFILNNNITVIPDNAFDRVQDTLKTLDLISLNLTAVPKALFSLNLTAFSLSNNSLTTLKGIPASKMIDLSYNNISDALDLAAALIPSAFTLHTLYMESNNLTAIPDLSDQMTMQMVVLNLNQISDSTSGKLPESLTSAHLSGNNLSSVPQVFASLSHLYSLVLSSNHISEINGELIPQQLEQLYLGNNNISEITASSFPDGSSLLYLDLQINPIVSIAPSAFEKLQKLQNLKLDNTSLVRVPVALTYLVNLETLSMENITNLNCTLPPDSELVHWFTCKRVKEVYGKCSNGKNIMDFYTVEGANPCNLAPVLTSLFCMFACLMVMSIA